MTVVCHFIVIKTVSSPPAYLFLNWWKSYHHLRFRKTCPKLPKLQWKNRNWMTGPQIINAVFVLVASRLSPSPFLKKKKKKKKKVVFKCVVCFCFWSIICPIQSKNYMPKRQLAIFWVYLIWAVPLDGPNLSSQLCTSSHVSQNNNWKGSVAMALISQIGKLGS